MEQREYQVLRYCGIDAIQKIEVVGKVMLPFEFRKNLRKSVVKGRKRQGNGCSKSIVPGKYNATRLPILRILYRRSIGGVNTEWMRRKWGVEKLYVDRFGAV